MYRPRIIPVLLLKNNVLYKSVQFKNHQYIGDPINAVKIFNQLNADELVFLDIEATKQNRCIAIDLVKNIGEEANMPFAVGGGISTIEQIKQIIAAGAEKVIINSYAIKNPHFITQAANAFGSSTISVCIDIKKNLFSKNVIRKFDGKTITQFSIIEFAKKMQDMGAGEIILQSVNNDGIMKGYDINLLKNISETLTIPLVALGGAGNLVQMKDAYQQANLNGLAAGSMFVYHGNNKGVLINYPSKEEINSILNV